MRFLFVMDPYAGMLPDKDTSFAFMRGALARGHESLHCEPRAVACDGKRVYATARPIRVSDAPPHFDVGPPERVELSALDAVLVRKDPPFDAGYLHLTHQLDLVRERTLVVNDPRALRDANEKLFALNFAEFMPTTLVSANTDEILEFVRRVGGKAVVKPLDGAGGSGVMGIDASERTSRGIVDYISGEGRRLVMAQEFLSEVTTGDKRVLLLDGKLLGAIRRVPRADDIRANIHVGGRVESTELSKKEAELVAAIGPRLAELGLWFVGLDLIAERLIEVNVTSPTGIQELGRLTGSRPEHAVIAWLEQRAPGVARTG
jgi:glutathione synthase